jgi:hypothetical protein
MANGRIAAAEPSDALPMLAFDAPVPDGVEIG